MQKVISYIYFFILILLTLLFFVYCEDHSDYFRNEPSQHTYYNLGEEIYKMLRDDLNDAQTNREKKIAFFESNHARFVEAVNSILPEGIIDDADQGLNHVIYYIDNGVLPEITKNCSEILMRLKNDPQAIDSFIKIYNGPRTLSYNDLNDFLNLITSYNSSEDNGFNNLIVNFLNYFVKHDGKSTDGLEDNSEDKIILAGLNSLSDILRNTNFISENKNIIPIDTTILEKILSKIGNHFNDNPRWIVMSDFNGNPKVLSNNNNILGPFIDEDSDNLCDVNEDGHPIDIDGNTIDIPPYDEAAYDIGNTKILRDSYGRAITEDGQLLYEYTDFNKTGLGSLTFGIKSLFEHNDYNELISNIKQFLGNKISDEQGNIKYDIKRFPFIDPAFEILNSTIDAINYEQFENVLNGFAQLFSGNRDEAKEFFVQALNVSKILENYKQVKLNPDNTLYDDLYPYFKQISDKGLLPRIIEIMDDPALDNLGNALKTLLTYRDTDLSETNDVFDEPVDRTAPESENNRSLLQRLLHLVHDASQKQYVTMYGEWVFTIDDMAVFFLDSVADNAEIPWYAKYFASEFDDSTPDSWQTTLFLNNAHPLIGNPTGREGNELRNYNGDSLFAFHHSGAKDALRPLIKVFSDTGNSALLAGILSQLHEHYSTLSKYTTDMTEQFDFYHVLKPAGIRNYEEALIDIFENSQILPATFQFISKCKNITLNNTTFNNAIDDYINQLFNGNVNLNSDEIIYNFDGITPNYNPSHIYVLNQHINNLISIYNNSTDQTVKDSFEKLVDIFGRNFLDLPDDNGSNETRAEILNSITTNSLTILNEYVININKIKSYEKNNDDFYNNVQQMHETINKLINSAELPAFVDMLNSIFEDEILGEDIKQFVLYLLNSDEQNDNLLRFARFISGIRQFGGDGESMNNILNFFADVVDPQKYNIDSIIRNIYQITGAEKNSVTFHALRNAYLAKGEISKSYPGDIIFNTIFKINRSEPGDSLPYDSNDINLIFSKILYFINDEHHGLERLYNILKNRNSY